MISVMAAVAVMLASSGCSSAGQEDLMQGIVPNEVEASTDVVQESVAVTDFGVRLFQAGFEEGANTLLSPLSVLCALSMTANGAAGDTLSQMEDVLGLSSASLNTYVHTYLEQLSGEKVLKLANSIWVKESDGFAPNQDFLQINADYYNAGIYQAPFDENTLKAINEWVAEKTDGMITNILDQIPEDAVMYLINALAFDAQWKEIYKNHQVRQRIFTTQSGEEQSVSMMFSDEMLYLEDDYATGFVKYYKGQDYAFAALLPKEGITLSEYVQTLTGEHLTELFTNSVNVHVDAAIPKFEAEYSTEMSGLLAEMGMPDAFDSKRADLSRLGIAGGNLYIDRVLHKTYITVTEQGTRAAAATAVEIKEECAVEYSETKTVHLTRPFVYFLIDTKTNTPFFIGTVQSIEN